MFITWQGRGSIVVFALIIPVALMTIGLLVFSRLEEITPLAKASLVCAPLVVGSVLAGGVCYRYGRRLNKGQNTHTFYGIPLQHWALIYWTIAAGGIVLFLIGLIHSHGH